MPPKSVPTENRIIPARAGFTRGIADQYSSDADHPRSRGVYGPMAATGSGIFGSSPLARGLLAFDGSFVLDWRIIPARAGFTVPFRSISMPKKDHPRSRGVYGLETADQFIFQGSSPLARGLLPLGVLSAHHGRIIPARAGFTSSLPFLGALLRDHPRSRGVYTCGSLESQRTRTLPDPCCLHCRPRVRSAELR